VGLATPAVKSSQATAEERPGGRSRAPYVVLGLYLLGALYMTVRLWHDPAGLAQNGDVHDVDQMSWFMRYSEQAVAHFNLPALVTGAMNAPHTVSLMWNTSLLLPGVILSPITSIAGPQVSLNILLVLGFAGSAASLYLVLRRWGASVMAAGLGGALYGFSPAMVMSGIGHYHLLLAMCPPLMIDALLRIVTGRGSALRSGLWLGVLASAQLFIGEEALIDTAIAAVVLLVVLVASRPRAVLENLRSKLVGLATAVVVAFVFCARALWIQFHGIALGSSGAATIVQHLGKLTHLYTIPYAWVVPSSKVVIHTPGSAHIAANYPQPIPEYLAYLGIPLIILLLVAGIYYWRVLAVRVAFCTFLLLELLSLGGQPIGPYPGAALPWYWIQDLPVIKSTLPDRLSILANGAAAAVLAFALDETIRRWRARETTSSTSLWRSPAVVCTGIAVVALLPLFPVSYSPVPVASVPAGYLGTYNKLHLPANASVLMIPIANGGLTQPMRWYADRAIPARMIGGDFIDASAKGRKSRSGRAGETVLGDYLNALWQGTTPGLTPTPDQVRAQMAAWKPSAIMADTAPTSPLGSYLIRVFGPPTVHQTNWLGWRLAS